MDGKTNQPTWTGEGQEISVLLLFSNLEIKIFDSKDYIAKLFERVRCALVLVAVNSQQITEFVRQVSNF